ncbi:MAG: hypothetical protein ACRDKL_08375 [Solirubrobacteraceae bacterium]
MIVMYLVRQPGHADLYWGGVALYGAVAVAMATSAATLWRRDRFSNWLWAASAVDMMAMTYMALPADDRDDGLTYAFVIYLAAEVVTWLSDPLPRLCARQVRALVRRRGSDLVAGVPAAGGETRSGTMKQAPLRPVVSSAAACESIRLVADVTLGVRVTLAVMSASMGWMLVAMQTMHMAAGPIT